jgi:cardiolipin synthase
MYEKAAKGVEVRVMVDLLGIFGDNYQNIFQNIKQIREMKRRGIQFDFFQPSPGSKMSPMDRLHFKLCAIDQNLVYIGGSNIGDHYTSWQDTNLRVDGRVGEIGHQLYDYVLSHSLGKHPAPELDLDDLWIGEARVILTVPGTRMDISDHWLDLIKTSESMVYFRNWYFLPNKEFMKAMLDRLANKVEVEVLLSHRTRIPIIDVANHTQSRILIKAGANIHRYQQRYMHSKVTWNSDNEILFGSANLEEKALKGNFELCLRFNDQGICERLTSAFKKDAASSLFQSKKVIKRRNYIKRITSYILSLATTLL